MTTLRGNHSGAPNIGSTVLATCTSNHEPTRYRPAKRITLRRFSSEKKLIDSRPRSSTLAGLPVDVSRLPPVPFLKFTSLNSRRSLSAQATLRFARSADRRGAGPRREAALRRRSSTFVMRWEHAAQLLVVARQAPCHP